MKTIIVYCNCCVNVVSLIIVIVFHLRQSNIHRLNVLKNEPSLDAESYYSKVDDI